MRQNWDIIMYGLLSEDDGKAGDIRGFTRHPARPVKCVQALIQYAEDRGLRALPATNSIGHVKAAPRLPVIGGKSFYRGKMVHFDELIMDLSHPDFYKLWFDYLDEYCSLFKHPEYCSIGTDEFHRGLSRWNRRWEENMRFSILNLSIKQPDPFLKRISEPLSTMTCLHLRNAIVKENYIMRKPMGAGISLIKSIQRSSLNIGVIFQV
ncbi:MAG: family 20 glycosylhydrolase [Victivallales bacterium]